MRKQIVFIVPDIQMRSLNVAYASDGITKTTETRQWEYDFKMKLRRYDEAIKEFKDYFMATRHFLTVEYIYFQPSTKIFTREKRNKDFRINMNSGDTSNFAKISDDVLLNDVLGIDDSIICKEIVCKLPYKGKRYFFKITVTIHDLGALWNLSEKLLPESYR